MEEFEGFYDTVRTAHSSPRSLSAKKFRQELFRFLNKKSGYKKSLIANFVANAINYVKLGWNKDLDNFVDHLERGVCGFKPAVAVCFFALQVREWRIELYGTLKLALGKGYTSEKVKRFTSEPPVQKDLVFSKVGNDQNGGLSFDYLDEVVAAFKPADEADDINFAPDLAKLDGVGWTQKPQDSEDFELAAEIFFSSAGKIVDHREYVFGLREAKFRIIPDGCEVTKYYRSSRGEMPFYIRFQKDNCWSLDTGSAPCDLSGMLDGSVLAGPLCVANSIDHERPAKLTLEVFVQKKAAIVKIFEAGSSNAVDIGDDQRKNLISKLQAIFVHKVNGLGEEHVILCSDSVNL